MDTNTTTTGITDKLRKFFGMSMFDIIKLLKKKMKPAKKNPHSVHSHFKHEGKHVKKEDFFEEVDEAIDFAKHVKDQNLSVKVYDGDGGLILAMGNIEDHQHEHYC